MVRHISVGPLFPAVHCLVFSSSSSNILFRQQFTMMTTFLLSVVKSALVCLLYFTEGRKRKKIQGAGTLERQFPPSAASLNQPVLYLHSFSSLSHDRSKASSKASSPGSAIQSFLLQIRVSSPFLKVVQQLPTSSYLSSCHFYPPLYLSFNNPLQKAVSTLNVTNPVRLPFT